MDISRLKEVVTFQRRGNDEGDSWVDYITTRAYINGVSGKEFFIANEGHEGAMTYTVLCRYRPELMNVTPMQYRIKHGSLYYDIISPGDDIQMKHEQVKFRVRRDYTEEDSGYAGDDTEIQETID